MRFLTFTSFNYPTTIFHVDFAKPRAAPRALGTAGRAGRSVDREVEQVWYPSKDGTQITMFLVHRKGLAHDGDAPTLLSGYGGFNISQTPAFSRHAVSWLERGGVFAVPNLRGGGEYGEAWHQAGMLGKKQNVFDDFIAAAEWLIANGYTNSREAGDQRRLERRPAGRRRRDAAAGAVPRRGRLRCRCSTWCATTTS